VRKCGFEPTLSTELDILKSRVSELFSLAGLEPPAPTEVATLLSSEAAAGDIKEVTDLLVASGDLHRVSDTLIFATEHIESMVQKVTAFLTEHGEMTTPQLKEITKTSRKYTVPLAEYLDAMKVTIRIKEVRKLRSQ